MNKRRWSAAGAGLILAGLLLAGCIGKSETMTETAPKGAANGSVTPDAKALKVGMVLDVGGPDDKSFNAAARAGLDATAHLLRAARSQSFRWGH